MGSWGEYMETDGGANRGQLGSQVVPAWLWMVEEKQNNNLIISVDEDSDHLRVDAMGRQEGPQHPTEMQKKKYPK